MRYVDLPSVLQTRRVVSIDALRGLNMFCIMGLDGAMWGIAEMSHGKGAIVDAVGSFLGDQFTHEYWEGLRFYDFIFPLFIFVTGVSIVLSLPRLVEREGKAKAHLRVLRRALLLYVMGVVAYGGISQHWADVRLLGVLQRIALCYLFTSVMFLNFNLRGLIAAVVGLLVGYWALMTFIPVPGIGAGSFAPDANLANWIDHHYLPGRLWDVTRDPEGMLSTLPAIATCLFGVLAGLLLRDSRASAQQKTLCLLAAGCILARGRIPLGAAISYHQGNLDVIVRSRHRRIQRNPARRHASNHRRLGMAALGHDFRMDRSKRDHALLSQRHSQLPGGRGSLSRWRFCKHARSGRGPWYRVLCYERAGNDFCYRAGRVHVSPQDFSPRLSGEKIFRLIGSSQAGTEFARIRVEHRVSRNMRPGHIDKDDQAI